tara:strand:+ start:1194 stop:1376 length:183 start_codon:yes stop_codon:yes gene_type:complete
MKICSICFLEYSEWGNNAEPINSGQCCDKCNWSVSIARMNRMHLRENYSAEELKELDVKL